MTVTLKVGINVKGKNEASTVLAAVGKSAEALSQKITAISTSYTAFGRQLMQLLGAPIRFAREAEDATYGLNTALKAAGRFNAEAAASMVEYADALERASGLSSEALQGVMKQGSLLKMNRDQTMALAEASTYLAKSGFGSVEESSNALIMSLTGNARQLKMNVAGVSELTEAQLRSGGAIRLVQEQLRKFVSSDTSTTTGAWLRITTAIGNYLEAVGLAILKGANLSGTMTGIVGALEHLTRKVNENEGSFAKLGQLFQRLVTGGLPTLVDLLTKLAPVADGVAWSFSKFHNVVNIIVNPIQGLIIRLRQLVATVKDVTSMADTGDKSRLGMWARLFGVGQSTERDALAKEMDLNRKAFEDHVDELLGIRSKLDVGPPAPGGNRFAASDYGPDRSLAPQKPFGGFSMGKPEEDKRLREDALEAQKQMIDDLVQSELRATNTIVADHYGKVQRVLELEAKAKKGGIDLSREAAQAQENLRKEFVKRIQDEQLKLNEEQAAAWHERTAAVAASLGDEAMMVELQYGEDMRKLTEHLTNKAITEEQFLKRSAEMREEMERAKANATNALISEKTASAVGAVVASAQGGLNSLVGTIGNMFGPWGSFIATIFQFFNQTPEKFRAMIEGLITQVMDAPKMIGQNIPILIATVVKSLPDLFTEFVVQWYTFIPKLIMDVLAAVIEMLPKVVGKVFSIGFWANIATRMFNAVADAFKNLWSVIFTGKAKKSVEDMGKPATTTGEGPARFGTNDPNAGGSEFKIKDAQHRAGSRVEQSFTQTFQDATENGAKSFTQMLQEAWDSIIERLGNWFSELPGKIWTGLVAFVERMKEFGSMIWEGLKASVANAWEIVKSWGAKLWEGVKASVAQGVEDVKRWGGIIWDGLVQSVKGGLDQLKWWGSTIWNGLINSVSNGWETLKSAGGKIWEGLKDLFLKGDWQSAGRKIWEGLKQIVGDSWQQLQDWGKTIWDGMKNTVGAGWQQLQDWGKTIWDGFWNSIQDIGGKLGISGGTNSWDGGGWKDRLSLNQGGFITHGMSAPALAAAFKDMGALQFATGGHVPGSGFRDTVPAVLTPGELVLNRRQVAALRDGGGGGSTYCFYFTVHPNAKLDRDAVRAMMPEVVSEIKNRTSRGELVVSKRGVY